MGFELGTDGPGAIVVGVDGSPTSLRAAAYAIGLARRQRATLYAVYARPSPSGLLAVADGSGYAVQAVMETQEAIGAALRKDLCAAGASFVTRQGDPLAVLAEVAAEVRAEALVVGSSTSFGHRIAGSLAVRLVRSARWPVTVVP